MPAVQPQVILIGGGVARIGNLLFGNAHKTVRERVVRCTANGVRVGPAGLGDDAGVLDAIAMFQRYGCN